MNAAGAAQANGATDSAKPQHRASRYARTRLTRTRTPAEGRTARQATSNAAAGTAAQNLTATANPSAAPAQPSRRGPASCPRLNAAFAASRQHRFIQGSSSSVRAASTSAGKTASSPQVTVVTSTPRYRTRFPASGMHAALAHTVSTRATASPAVGDAIEPTSAAGSDRIRMPGGCTNAKSR
jgi:hypothetical protein